MTPQTPLSGPTAAETPLATGTASERTIPLRDGQFRIVVQEGGVGTPLIFLHGLGATSWDPFLAGLAASHRVIAPSLPGSSGGSTGLEHLLDHHDLFFLYQELLDALLGELDVESVTLVGHSFGGWLAAELAAAEPARVSSLVLIAPLGLWNDADPVADFFALLPAELAAAAFHDASHPLALAMQDMGESEAEKKVVMLRRARDNRAVARFIWPIPDKGLSKRIQRVRAKTLLVWGESDGIVPPRYAEDFAGRIAGSRVEMIAAAGHLPQVEQPEATLTVVRAFLH